MLQDSAPSSSGAQPELPAEETAAIDPLALVLPEHASLAEAAHLVTSRLSRLLNVPAALLSRDRLSWRFEAQAFPQPLASWSTSSRAQSADDPVRQLQEDSGQAWTAAALGMLGDREWTLLVPGQASAWSRRSGFDALVERVARDLGEVAAEDVRAYANRLQRRVLGFSRRLARVEDSGRLNALVLKVLARQTRARTASVAMFDDEDGALAVVATHGYPASIVEHLRIQPGEGALGRAYLSGRASVESVGEGDRRLRYRTDSYMVLPVLAGRERLAIVTLTDREDGQAFDARDFAAARLLASLSAAAFSRERLRAGLAGLTELARVDAVTGLFNRRYFETRLSAEVERARRQGHDLAVLIIDIDDFKKVNDTRGHLEGDRTLREVADVLRGGVRIFDVCARYGGEEFVIVMPSAAVEVAQQVAERIRAHIERSFVHDVPSVTISVGIGMLHPGWTAFEVLDVADRALIAAKQAGKNVVRTGN